MPIPISYAQRPFPGGRHITRRQVSLREDCLPSGFPPAAADDGSGPRTSPGIASRAPASLAAVMQVVSGACLRGLLTTRLRGSGLAA
jgi:hypothetical protein